MLAVDCIGLTSPGRDTFDLEGATGARSESDDQISERFECTEDRELSVDETLRGPMVSGEDGVASRLFGVSHGGLASGGCDRFLPIGFEN